MCSGAFSEAVEARDWRWRMGKEAIWFTWKSRCSWYYIAVARARGWVRIHFAQHKMSEQRRECLGKLKWDKSRKWRADPAQSKSSFFIVLLAQASKEFRQMGALFSYFSFRRNSRWANQNLTSASTPGIDGFCWFFRVLSLFCLFFFFSSITFVPKQANH